MLSYWIRANTRSWIDERGIFIAPTSKYHFLSNTVGLLGWHQNVATEASPRILFDYALGHRTNQGRSICFMMEEVEVSIEVVTSK